MHKKLTFSCQPKKQEKKKTAQLKDLHKKLTFSWTTRQCFSQSKASFSVKTLLQKKLKMRHFLVKTLLQKQGETLLQKQRKTLLQKQGQTMVESLFFVICILSFLSVVQFFQLRARGEIQKERLIKKSSLKKGDKKFSASWHRPDLQK